MADEIKTTAAEAAQTDILTSNEDPMELSIQSDRFASLDLSKDLTSSAAAYCSLIAADDQSRITLYNACSSPKQLSDMINKQIKLLHVYVEVIQVISEQSGERVNVPRVVLIDDHGVGYQAVSIGIYNAVKRLLQTFGDPTTWSKAHTVEVQNVSLKNGQHTFSLLLVD